jgi:hypothetical protein
MNPIIEQRALEVTSQIELLLKHDQDLKVIGQSLKDLSVSEAKTLLGRVSATTTTKKVIAFDYYLSKVESLTLNDLEMIYNELDYNKKNLIIESVLNKNTTLFSVNNKELPPLLNGIDAKIKDLIVTLMSKIYSGEKESLFSFWKELDNLPASAFDTYCNEKENPSPPLDQRIEKSRDELLKEPLFLKRITRENSSDSLQDLIGTKTQTVREFIPKEWCECSSLEIAQSLPKQIEQVTTLISSQGGLASTKDSPIFWEGDLFSNACLNAYLNEKITLDQLVSATLLFVFLRESGIKEPDKITRISLKETPKFPLKEGAPESETYYYVIKVNFKDLKDGMRWNFSDNRSLIPIQFVEHNNTLSIPSFSSFQHYLDLTFGQNSIRLIPRWGDSSKNEIYEQALKGSHVFGLNLDRTGSIKADNIDFGAYGFSLHDFYHSYILSMIPVKDREKFLEISKNLLIEIKKHPKYSQELEALAWKFTDMEFNDYRNEWNHKKAFDNTLDKVLGEIRSPELLKIVEKIIKPLNRS